MKLLRRNQTFQGEAGPLVVPPLRKTHAADDSEDVGIDGHHPSVAGEEEDYVRGFGSDPIYAHQPLPRFFKGDGEGSIQVSSKLLDDGLGDLYDPATPYVGEAGDLDGWLQPFGL